MNRFQRIRIRGFRRLRDTDVEVRPLTLLIGANGYGKTSFLDVWALLAACSEGRLAATLTSEFQGLNSVLTRGQAEELAFDLCMSVAGNAPLDYHLVIRPKGQSYQVAEESLSQRNPSKSAPFKHIQSRYDDIRYFDKEVNRLVRPNWDYQLLETALSQVPKMFQVSEDFRRRLSSCVRYAALAVQPNAPIRIPQPLTNARLPGANGETLVSFLFTLRESDPERFEVVEDTLRAAFPDFERLSFPPVAAGTLAMTWKDKNFKQPMYMHELSEGTLRFLWLAALLLSRALPEITLIDEPEVSLHPEMLKILVDLMREASQRTQLIVATHSDRLIRFAKPEEVLVVDADEGFSTLRWGDTLDLNHWLADYTLDEIWAMGVMGGRP